MAAAGAFAGAGFVAAGGAGSAAVCGAFWQAATNARLKISKPCLIRYIFVSLGLKNYGQCISNLCRWLKQLA
jgi:hypothetical protein